MINESLYFVFNPNRGTPKHRHGSCVEAREEAERLAELSPGEEFFVCRCVESIKKLPTPYLRKVYSKKG